MNRVVAVAVSAFAVSVVVVAGACALPLPVPAPLLPAPPFQYISRPRLQAAMWRLADDVTTINHMLEEPTPPQADILTALNDMQAAVSMLSTPGLQTNHPLLDKELPRFALDIATARSDVGHDPPRYASAQALSSACLRCHGGDR